MGAEEHSPSPSSSFTKTPNLNEAILLISSLISLSHSIRVFTAKWQSVRVKLEELFSNLTAIENCDSRGNLSISVALESFFATLKRCGDLGSRCSELSFTGKLLMQSDLDLLSSKLDFHIKNFSDIYAAGLLNQSSAIVVSRPSFSASKEDVKFYINDIISRLRIGSSDMKKQALIAFHELIQEDEKYTKIALEIDGFVNVVLKFLDSHEREIQEEAAKTLFLIVCFHSSKSLLTNAGAIAPLVRVIESGSESTQSSKEFAAKCLMRMTENSDNVWAVSAHGGVTALLKICCSKNVGFILVCLSCKVLKNLVPVEEIKRFMVEEGAIVGLLELARSKDEGIKISSLDLLQKMAYKDESIQEMIIKEGGIQALVPILDPKSPFSTKVKEIALRTITTTCFSSPEISITTMLSYSFMDHILYILRYGETSLQELALKAAYWLCGTSLESKKLMGDEGFIPVLVNLLDSKSYETREMAGETLSMMMVVSKNRKRFIQNDENVGVLLQMLDPNEVNTTNRRLLLSILMCLINSRSARKKIVSSGYLKNIEKLAEAEVSEAKKIVRKLSSNRFSSVLKVFWHS